MLIILMHIMRNMANNAMYIVEKLHPFSQSFNGITFKVISFPSIFSLHSSTNLSTSFFLHLQFF